MNNDKIKQEVSISGKIVITDWRNIKLAPPENLQDKTKVNESAREEIKKQKISANHFSTIMGY